MAIRTIDQGCHRALYTRARRVRYTLLAIRVDALRNWHCQRSALGAIQSKPADVFSRRTIPESSASSGEPNFIHFHKAELTSDNLIDLAECFSKVMFQQSNVSAKFQLCDRTTKQMGSDQKREPNARRHIEAMAGKQGADAQTDLYN